MKAISRKSIKRIAAMEFVIAFGFVAFWAAFFSMDLVSFGNPRLEEIYRAFESAFPPADIFLVILLVLGGIGLLKRMPFGYFFTLMAGAALIFLGLLDSSFNARQGIYAIGRQELVLNIGINATCIAAGAFFVGRIWKELSTWLKSREKESSSRAAQRGSDWPWLGNLPEKGPF
jgi:hypothetical protein